MSGKKGMKHYPKELKLEAVRMFFEEGKTRAEITEALGLRSAGRVMVWTRQYRREGLEAFNKPIGRPPKREESEQAELERLRMENALLKKYHAWVKRSSQPDKDAEGMRLVQEAWEKSRKIYGYRRVTLWLKQKKGLSINHKAVLRLMKKMKIRSVARKRKPYKKMTELGTYHRYENILNRDFSAEKANQKWVTDITYVLTQHGWAYWSTIKDLFDGFIVAHQLGRQNSVRLVTDTLKEAKKKEKTTKDIMLHSDQGYQYTSQAYFLLTKTYKMTPSMSRRGNCWDNASMENFFGHFKEEALRQFPTPTFEQAQEIVDDYVAFYNYERIQLKTRQTPYQTRCLSK